jgi:hypothetical protein
MAVKMVDEVHKKSGGGMGELLANDVVLDADENKVKSARLSLPDARYEEGVSPEEQKATDLLDFCFSVASAGFQTGGEQQGRHNIQIVLKNYGDAKVKEKVVALCNEERPNFSVQNKPRLGFDRLENAETVFARVREIIKEEAISGAVQLK